MTNLRLAIAAALLTGAALPALAVDTKPVTNPGATDAAAATSSQAATPTQTNSSAGSQTVMNSGSSMGISSDASATQRKGTHLNAAQRAKADAEEAETTRQLNQQAAAMAAPDRTAMR